VVGMLLALVSVRSDGSGAVLRLLRYLVDRPLLSWGLASVILVVQTNLHGNRVAISLPLIGVLNDHLRYASYALLCPIAVGLVMLPIVFDKKGSLPQRILSWRPFLLFGAVSYGVYLWHDPFSIWLVDRMSFTAGWPLWCGWPVLFVVVLAFALAMGVLSYFGVELPLRRPKLPLGRRDP